MKAVFLICFLVLLANPFRVTGKGVQDTLSPGAPSFREYLIGIHQLIGKEIRYNRSLQYQLSADDTLQRQVNALLWNDSVWQSLLPYADSSFVLVNIPSNTLLYVEQGKMVFSLRTVTGKRSTPTPVLSSHIRSIIQYPYWNVPHSIAVNELLPFIRRNPGIIKILRLEVLAGNEVIGDPYQLPWSEFSKVYFPYRLRQLPGPQNALGLIKFDFPNTYHVYLHDTNDKTAFDRARRYYSHGCIRVEDPLRLAMQFGFRPDTVASAGNKALKPATFVLKKPVRIFIIYATIAMTDHQLAWLQDIYNKVNRAGRKPDLQPVIIKIEN